MIQNYFRYLQKYTSIFYLSLVGIGMLFEYFKYREFGVNVFEYGDLFYFLISPFKDPLILLFVLASFFALYIIYMLDFMWKTKSPMSYSKVNMGIDKKPWFGIYRTIVFVVLTFLYILLAAQLYGKYKREVLQSKSSNSILIYDDNTSITGKVIGKTNEFIFIQPADKVVIVPTGSLKEIRL